IVSAIFLDDVNHMLDGRTTSKKTCGTRTQQTIVPHDLLCVTDQRRIIGHIYGTDISDDDRGAVLSALSAGATASRRKTFVRRIRNATRVVDHQRRILHASPFAVADEDRLSNNGYCRWILTSRN